MNMQNLKRFACGAALILTSLFSNCVLAESFKNSDFLKLDNEQKKVWILASIETIWQIEAHKNKEAAQCIAGFVEISAKK